MRFWNAAVCIQCKFVTLTINKRGKPADFVSSIGTFSLSIFLTLQLTNTIIGLSKRNNISEPILKICLTLDWCKNLFHFMSAFGLCHFTFIPQKLISFVASGPALHGLDRKQTIFDFTPLHPHHQWLKLEAVRR